MYTCRRQKWDKYEWQLTTFILKECFIMKTFPVPCLITGTVLIFVRCVWPDDEHSADVATGAGAGNTEGVQISGHILSWCVSWAGHLACGHHTHTPHWWQTVCWPVQSPVPASDDHLLPAYHHMYCLRLWQVIYFLIAGTVFLFYYFYFFSFLLLTALYTNHYLKLI